MPVITHAWSPRFRYALSAADFDRSKHAKIYVDQDADLLLVTSQEYHSRARKSLLLFKSVPQQSSVNKFDSV